MMDNRDYLRRHAYLLSLLEDTDTLLGAPRLSLVHADSSFLLFDPRLPNPWLFDDDQVRWLLGNHDQIERHGHPFMRRIFAFPIGVRRSLDEQRIFRATVRAVLHLQMFEGVRVAILPVTSEIHSRRFNFSLMAEGTHRIAWPAWHYYESIQSKEARRAKGPELQEVLARFSTIAPNLLWLSPYRPKHFERGTRLALPKSWRRFLFVLHNGRCADCNAPVDELLAHVDHMRPIKPEQSPFHYFVAGNSVIFNLSLLCRACNLAKSNRFRIAPEELITRIAPNPTIADYLKLSFTFPPSDISHVLPDMLAPIGEETVVVRPLGL